MFVEFFETRGRNDVRAAWVNRLTVSHYQTYLRQLDFKVVRQWTTGTPIDEAFYQRFIDKLGRYPRFDLEKDFIYMVLGLRRPPQPPVVPARPARSPLSSRIRRTLRPLRDAIRGTRS